MIGAPLWSVVEAAEEQEGELVTVLLNEFEKPARCVIPLLTITLPPTTTTLQFSPDATELSDAEHVAVPGVAFHLNLDDPPDTPDDDTTHIRHDATDTRAESRVSFPSLTGEIRSIEAVRLYVRAITNQNASFEDDGSWIFALRVNGTNYFKDGLATESESERFFNNSYRTQVYEYTTNPDTGLAWARTEVDALQASIISQPDAVGDVFGQHFTQVYIEVDVTSSDIGRYSNETVNSKSEGVFEGKVLTWGRIANSVLNKQNGIESSKTSVTIADYDRSWSQLVASTNPIELRGSVVTIRLASPDVTDKSAWSTRFTGILKSWNEIKPDIWKLNFAPNDDSMLSTVPKIKITEFDFESADAKIYDNYAPLIYGTHDSENITDDGMVQCYRVDTVNNIYLISLGVCKTILRIYAQKNNETPILLTEGVAADQWQRVANLDSLINGRQWTLIEFPAGFSTLDPQEDAFTADVEGYEETGDGTGLLLTNGAEQLKHLYVNFGFGDYSSGLWLADSTAPVDVNKFNAARDFLNSLGQSNSRYIGGKGSATKVKDEINRFNKNVEMKAFWTGEGNLAIAANDHTTPDVLAPRQVILDGLHDLSDPSFNFDDSQLLSRILVSYIHQQDGGSFLANIEISDLTVVEGKTESLQAFWLPSEIP